MAAVYAAAECMCGAAAAGRGVRQGSITVLCDVGLDGLGIGRQLDDPFGQRLDAFEPGRARGLMAKRFHQELFAMR